MNYQNNIDAYYAYAKENHKRRKKEERVTWLWLIASIIMLFGVWAYYSNLNLLNVLGMDENSSKSNASEMSLVDDLNNENELGKSIKVSSNNNLVNNEKSEKSKDERETSSDMALKENSKTQPLVFGNSTKEIAKDHMPIGLLKVAEKNNSKEKKSSIEENNLTIFQNSSDMNSSLMKDNNTSLILTKGADINGSIDKNSSLLKVDSLEQNSSTIVEDKSLEENVSVELFHVYIVSKGETIYDIARKEYGDTQMYIEIVNANQDLENPNKIHEGQELFLPIVNESKSYSDILHFR